MEKLETTKELKGKGRSMAVHNRQILIGQSDCKVKVWPVVGDESWTIKLGYLGIYQSTQTKSNARGYR